RWDLARIVVQSIKTGERKTILEGGSDARYLPSGHLVYAVAGRLLAAPFDVDRLVVTRSAIAVVEGVSRSASGIAHFSYSKNGSLIYVPGPVTTSLSQQRLAVFDRAGGVLPLKLPPGPYEFPRVSPDGQHLAVGRSDSKGAAISIYDLTGTSSMR